MLERPGEGLRVRGCSTSTKIGFKFSTKWKMSITNPAFAVLSQSRRSGRDTANGNRIHEDGEVA